MSPAVRNQRDLFGETASDNILNVAGRPGEKVSERVDLLDAEVPLVVHRGVVGRVWEGCDEIGPRFTAPKREAGLEGGIVERRADLGRNETWFDVTLPQNV